MPLDTTTSNASLSDQLAWMGIEPVPMTVLEAHKVAQLCKYRRSLLVTIWPNLFIGILICGVVLAMQSGRFPVPDTIIAVMAGGAAMIITRMMTGCLCLLFDHKILGDPKWIEHLLSPAWIDYPLSHSRASQVPEPIREVMQRAKHLPCKLLFGQLIQNEIILDPYIVVEAPSGRYCLGIWENDEVIACATLH